MATNYERYFGTPELFAKSLSACTRERGILCPMHVFEGRSCADCEAEEDGGCQRATLEWLNEEAE